MKHKKTNHTSEHSKTKQHSPKPLATPALPLQIPDSFQLAAMPFQPTRTPVVTNDVPPSASTRAVESLSPISNNINNSKSLPSFLPNTPTAPTVTIPEETQTYLPKKIGLSSSPPLVNFNSKHNTVAFKKLSLLSDSNTSASSITPIVLLSVLGVVILLILMAVIVHSLRNKKRKGIQNLEDAKETLNSSFYFGNDSANIATISNNEAVSNPDLIITASNSTIANTAVGEGGQITSYLASNSSPGSAISSTYYQNYGHL